MGRKRYAVHNIAADNAFNVPHVQYRRNGAERFYDRGGNARYDAERGGFRLRGRR